MKKYIISLIVAVVITTLLILFYIVAVNYLNEGKNEEITLKLNKNCEKIDHDFGKIKQGAISLANRLSEGKLPFNKIEDSILNIVEKNSNYTGAIVAFAPNKFRNKKLYCKYALRKDNKIQLIHIEDIYDYTSDEYSWFNKPLKDGAQWNNIHLGIATGELFTAYAVPFYNPNDTKNNNPIGVVCIVKTLRELRDDMSHLSFGKSGYPILMTSEGEIIYHPDKHHVTDKKTIHNIIHSDNKTTSADIKSMLNSNAGSFKYQETDNNQNIQLEYKRIESTNWILAIYTLVEEIESNYYRIYSFKIIIICCLIIIITLLLRIIFRKKLWSLSITLTILYISGVASICYLTPDYVTKSNNEVKVYEKENVNSYLNDIGSVESAIKIPTGLFIQSLECTNANNFVVKGYVWQKYTVNNPAQIDKGVIFPEALDVKIKHAYTDIKGDTEVIGWEFKATIREVFDYSNYPFDYCRYWIRMKHKDITKNIILVPDFKSYNIITPKYKPGIEKDFVLPGRSIIKSFFSFRNNSYNTNLGIQGDNRKSSPELYFNILVKREFASPFISHLVPVIVIILMLFSILQLGRKNDKKGLMGFNSMSTISACSALFFVVIFNHISLRNELDVSGIVYIEFFYIVTYLSILFVSVISLMIAFDWRYKFVNYNNALYARVTFFPVLTFLLLVITALEFIL
ncbi:MAG: Cache 3/Cache 2 fusion domain-containing protein [Bacteroidales bacterium]|jgi:hypothetical protein|nr:Cache 3/Cache 2 fusion domain-containing protein [Bacteroidales bacterium]